MTPLPLVGVRILAVEQYGAGPFGSMYLADLGADVIKIENPPRGDVSRQTGPYFLGNDDSEFFQTFNLNKSSVVLDLKSAEGRRQFESMVGDCDAVINNLRGDQPAKLGLDYATLGRLKPTIVCAHLSAYGRDNSRSDWPGYDYLMQAEAGFMHLTGEPGAAPARFGLSMVDYMTGVTTALGLTAAMLAVARGGSGCDVDVSLFDVAIHQLSYPATWYLNQGHVTERLPRSAHPTTVPCQLYRTQDGWIFIMAMTEKFWKSLVDTLDCEDLRDPHFADVGARRAKREELTILLDGQFSRAPTQVWLDRLRGVLPIAPVYNLEQALENPYLREVGMLGAVPHPACETLRVLKNPIKINGRRMPSRAAPSLGASDVDKTPQFDKPA